ncbi:embryonic polarity protein dorsal-like isoform X2 [Panonychus citri]|uniref:embryonic polarity protein dorsal-like isoform X2 n=1 Tax=Panonychus citri TaxID=50023 RepID=UPI0023076135|nr:embryonic polarity protein dorsal-like isoform X2 [Panonychus citri]
MSLATLMACGEYGEDPNVPHLKILEQPARCALRFRYECEGRSAGSIPGSNSTPENKTYPSIQIESFKGPAVVVVSCVTKDFPYRPHPHNLVGKDGCKKGVCTMVINNPDMICSFTSLGIQCVKRKDIEDSLKLRESIKVDPFRTGFAHKNQSSSIDLNVVRLCFQVFVEGPEKDKFTIPLRPVVSDPIYDKKAMSDLIITKLSHFSAPVIGGREIILLCDRVAKDDIQIRFFEESNGQLIWEGYADFQPNDVHKQVAISFRSPKYYNENISSPVTVNIQLRRPSDGHTSESRSFQFLPKGIDPDGLTRKRQKVEESDCLNRYIKDNSSIMSQMQSTQPRGLSPLDYPSSSRSPLRPQEPVSPAIPDRIDIDLQSEQQQSQWNDFSQLTGPSLGGPLGIQRRSPSYNRNMVNTPSPTSIPHCIQESNLQSKSSAIPQTISYSLTPHYSPSPRGSLDMSSTKPLASNQQHLQQQQQQQSKQSQPFQICSDNMNPPTFNHHQQQLDQQQQNNFGSISGNNYVPDDVNSFLKNLSPAHLSNNMMIEPVSPVTPPHQQVQPSSSFNHSPQHPNLPTMIPSINNNLNNNEVEGALTSKLDSLDLDIDSHELLRDIGLQSWLVMMDSGNNVNISNSGTINLHNDPNTHHDHSNRASNL